MNENKQYIDSGMPQSYHPLQAQPQDDIDWLGIWNAVWPRKWLIVLITFVFTSVGIYYALQQPNFYKAVTVLAPTQSDGKGGGLSAQFGGLATLAGINLSSGGGGGTETAIAILNSRKFGEEFIRKYDLKKDLFANKWDPNTEQWIVVEPNFFEGMLAQLKPQVDSQLKDGEPSMWSAYELFSQIVSVGQNKNSGLVTLSIEFTDPQKAAEWANLLVIEINALIRSQQLSEAQNSNKYLQEQLKKTSISEVKMAIYQIIESNIKTMTLANISNDAAFKVIDPAVIPQIKSKPKRSMIVFGFMFVGLFLSIGFYVLRFFLVGSSSGKDEKS
ncbi:LPS O-antigen length regulator [uncultured Thiomicrorhabdus sp.]